ncbi:hypothetical protein U9M48_007254 [Paspalum notatum var. saurae]|uniref:BZIP domain-containing protein n=1 Tax=Paspalum notatum var. saurae TaxID=547442 RepID=A0AAQ3PWB1_PASNO
MGAKAMSSHHGSGAGAGAGAGGGAGALSRQASVCSLTFSEVDGQLHGVNLDDLLRAGRKTADEVWRDIQGAAACPRAQTMTLEDFLSRAGDGAGARGWAHQQQVYQPAPQQLGHQGHHPSIGRPVPRPLGVGAGPVLGALYQHDAHGGAAKRAAPEGGVAERSNERRKKRMIKNRESAARSRARKQAYTNELENKIKLLEEENERLLRHQALEPVVQYVPQHEPKNQHRRVNSANF